MSYINKDHLLKTFLVLLAIYHVSGAGNETTDATSSNKAKYTLHLKEEMIKTNKKVFFQCSNTNFAKNNDKKYPIIECLLPSRRTKLDFTKINKLNLYFNTFCPYVQQKKKKPSESILFNETNRKGPYTYESIPNKKNGDKVWQFNDIEILEQIKDLAYNKKYKNYIETLFVECTINADVLELKYSGNMKTREKSDISQVRNEIVENINNQDKLNAQKEQLSNEKEKKKVQTKLQQLLAEREELNKIRDDLANRQDFENDICNVGEKITDARIRVL